MRIFKRGKKGTYWYDFSIHGRRYRDSTKLTNKAAAERMAVLVMQEALTKGAVALLQKAPVLRDFSTRFLKWVDESPLDRDTRLYYHNGWRVLSRTDLAGMRMDQITSDDAATTAFTMETRGKKRQIVPASAATANNALRTLRRMLGKAVEWHQLAVAPKIKLRKEVGRKLVIDDAMEDKLLAVAEQPLRDVLIIMRDTGMRPEEIFRMRSEYVSWATRTYCNPHGKTAHASRVIPLSERVHNLLVQRWNGKPEGWLFPSARAEEGHLTTVAKQFQAARTAAKLPSNLVLYCARHDFGTYALQATGNLFAVMAAMGHASTSTAQKYQHPGLDQLRDAIDERNRLHATAGQEN